MSVTATPWELAEALDFRRHRNGLKGRTLYQMRQDLAAMISDRGLVLYIAHGLTRPLAPDELFSLIDNCADRSYASSALRSIFTYNRRRKTPVTVPWRTLRALRHGPAAAGLNTNPVTRLHMNVLKTSAFRGS